MDKSEGGDGESERQKEKLLLHPTCWGKGSAFSPRPPQSPSAACSPPTGLGEPKTPVLLLLPRLMQAFIPVKGLTIRFHYFSRENLQWKHWHMKALWLPGWHSASKKSVLFSLHCWDFRLSSLAQILNPKISHPLLKLIHSPPPFFFKDSLQPLWPIFPPFLCCGALCGRERGGREGEG